MNDSGPVIHAYQVIERIGNGCFATVLKARHRSNGRLVALKIEPKHTSIRHESRVLSFLRRELSPDNQHCVPTVYWYGTYGGKICLAMTFYERAIGRPDDIMATLDLCRQIVAAFRWMREAASWLLISDWHLCIRMTNRVSTIRMCRVRIWSVRLNMPAILFIRGTV